MTTTFRRRDPYTRDQRHEINLVARAIAQNDTVNDADWMGGAASVSSNPRGLAPDALSTDMIRAYMDEVRNALECVRWTLAGEFARAQNFAADSVRYGKLHATLSRQFERRAVTVSGRRGTGDTFTLEIDGVRFYFDLLLGWDQDGSRLQILNRAELQRAAHLPDLHADAWDDLEQWITVTDLRAKRVRQTEFDDQLIYRESKTSLELREPIQRDYPCLPDALRAIACTLRSSVTPSNHEPRAALPESLDERRHRNTAVRELLDGGLYPREITEDAVTEYTQLLQAEELELERKL